MCACPTGSSRAKRGAFLVLHGFGSNKDSSNVLAPAKVLTELGYVTLRFSMRGCGDSEGEFGIGDLPRAGRGSRNALTFLARPSGSRSQAHRGRRLELWRRSCGLCRRCRRAGGCCYLKRRLG
jgi:hypothetical protein